ncbi:hypothetical protein ADL22_02310 [Streptomyces sp. NRRL F-4489]|uniref:hypothetical protein n=1 Tax=Streptomyces sp. NRRL F-4489 TaxID=1609095 RepID=UPI00074B2DEE|nr:hypothetical protein [Streptomyces sp. NRRL F-4489]KUL54788.1 hypothetical protein ADL22_02310 [Streptomyces sp. NRRL F-4489]
MKARKGWSAAGRLAAAAAGALALAGMLPATATAADPEPQGQGYRCQFVQFQELPRVEGFNCQAFGGAPERGPIFGEFRIHDSRGMTVHCQVERPYSGIANLPRHVEGFNCRPGGFPGD